MSSPQHQQHQQQLEEAIRTILNSNFDADSKICFVTLLKIIDNVLQKPGNSKVRSLRTSNKAIQTKIVDRGGDRFLLACGFVPCREPATIGNPLQLEDKLVLNPASEDINLLIQARHTLANSAVRALGMTPDELPVYKPPPQRQPTPTTTSSSSSSQQAFDVYQGRRFDGQSAAVGTNLGAPEHWQSKTEQDLLVLQQREAKLQREIASKHAATTTKKSTTSTTNHPPAIDRQWTVFLPGQSQPPSSSSSSIRPMPAAASVDRSGGDSSLLASHFKQQHAKRVASENRGFTTKAMRDLEKIQKTKVYSHTQLAIHFPDGVSVRANFSTTEPLDAVVQSLWEDVLLPARLPPLELYQTPPRRVLATPTATLHQLGLVPTAKIYVSWKQPLRAANTTLVAGWYVRPKLLRKPPPSRPVLPTYGIVLPPSWSSSSTTTTTTKRKMTNAAGDRGNTDTTVNGKEQPQPAKKNKKKNKNNNGIVPAPTRELGE